MNTIFIDELRLDTRIGVYAWEQHLAQPVVLDIEYAPASAKPFLTDDFADAIDYAAVVARLKTFALEHRHKLIERFAEAIAEIVRSEFGAPWVRVRVAKLAPIAGLRHVGVVIERGMRPA